MPLGLGLGLGIGKTAIRGEAADSLIFRIAQELHRLAEKNGGVSQSALDMIEDARAIVMVLREPSGPMLEEGRRSDLSPDASHVWQRMVDAALGEQIP